MNKKFITPELDKCAIVYSIQGKVEETITPEKVISDKLVIVDCDTSADNFKTIVQVYENKKIQETFEMNTDQWLFWFDCYFPDMAGTRNVYTNLIQKICVELLRVEKLDNEEFEILWDLYITEMGKII